MEYQLLREAKVLILYPLKTSGNQRFSSVLWGYKMGTLAKDGLYTKLLLHVMILQRSHKKFIDIHKHVSKIRY